MAINNTCQKPSLVPKGPLALMPKCNDDHFCFFSHLVERTKVMSVLLEQPQDLDGHSYYSDSVLLHHWVDMNYEPSNGLGAFTAKSACFGKSRPHNFAGHGRPIMGETMKQHDCAV